MPDREIFRFSRRFPETAAGLAWIEFPGLDPDTNVSLIETGRFVAENRDFAWQDRVNEAVRGYFTQTDDITGSVFQTVYNANPSGAAAAVAGTSGVATYTIPREGSNLVSPSGFVIQNFTSEIRVLPPREDRTGVWRLRIQDGVIFRRYVMQPTDQTWLRRLFSADEELVLFYSLPETGDIGYLHEEGVALQDGRVLDVSGVVATVADEHTVQLPDEDLYQIRSVRVNGQELITSPSGQISVDSPPPAGPFTAWDPLDGRFTLDRTIDESDEVIVDYRFRGQDYLFEGYLDDALLFHDLDLNPSPGHTYDNGRLSSELLNTPIYVYLLPTAAYSVKDAGGTYREERRIYTYDRFTRSALRWERTETPVSVSPSSQPSDPCRVRSTFGHTYYGTAKFVDATPVDNLNAVTSGTASLANFPSAIVLAKIYTTSNAQIENVRVIDVRRRGGGIPESVSLVDPTLPGRTKRESETYWDIAGWDGSPVPLAGVLVVELPGGLLTGEGYTQFSMEEIDQFIRSHLGAGIRYVVRWV
jgi:hypothetical protein